VHEKLADGTLCEIHKASGGPWGGTNVDEEFFKWLETIFGKRAMSELDFHEHLDMQRELETIKRDLKLNSTNKMKFNIPSQLRRLSLQYKEKHRYQN